jgi:hypothetical protein
MFTPTQTPSFAAMTRDVAEINQDGEDAWKWRRCPLLSYSRSKHQRGYNKVTKCDVIRRWWRGVPRPHKETLITKLCTNESRLSQFQDWNTASSTLLTTSDLNNPPAATCYLRDPRFQQATRRHYLSLPRRCISKPVPSFQTTIHYSFVFPHLSFFRSIYLCSSIS